MSSISSSTTGSPVADAIRANLEQALEPIRHLEIWNESHKHNVPRDSETHFKVIIVADKFEEIRNPVQRHRLVNQALQEQLDGPVHALSIVAKSPSQWSAMIEEGKTVQPSPSCRGGDGTFSRPKHSWS